MPEEMYTYNFGEKSVWPKPDLSSPFDVLKCHAALVRDLSNAAQYADAYQREDHFIKNLDTLAFSLQECIFKVMVLREALTGFKTRHEQEKAQDG
jgi:4'-phosphopantetheinyl transferase EntD